MMRPSGFLRLVDKHRRRTTATVDDLRQLARHLAEVADCPGDKSAGACVIDGELVERSEVYHDLAGNAHRDPSREQFDVDRRVIEDVEALDRLHGPFQRGQGYLMRRRSAIRAASTTTRFMTRWKRGSLTAHPAGR
jgi:hypothetical protein